MLIGFINVGVREPVLYNTIVILLCNSNVVVDAAKYMHEKENIMDGDKRMDFHFFRKNRHAHMHTRTVHRHTHTRQ